MKHIITFIVIILFTLLGVRNGFAQTYTTNDTTGNWSEASTWSGGTVPAYPYDNAYIEINGLITLEGSFSAGSNFGSLTVIDTLIITANCMLDGTGGIVVQSGGVLIVKGAISNTNNAEITINSGGSIVVYGDAQFSSNVNIVGDLVVSGNFTYTGGGTLSLDGTLVVGGDFNLGGANTTVDNNGYIGVLGDMDVTTGNFPTQEGEIAVIGEYTCTGNDCDEVSPTIEDSFDEDDPILSIDLGLDVIDYLLSGTYTNTSGGNESAVLYTLGENTLECYYGVEIIASLEYSGGADDSNCLLEYNLNGNGWVSMDPTEVKTLWDVSTIDVRLRAVDWPNGASVTLTNLIVSGTNEGNAQATEMAWDNFVVELCPVDTATYSVADAEEYSSINWTITSGTGSFVDGINTGGSVDIRWEVLPGIVTAEGAISSCGFTTETLSVSGTVTQTGDLVVDVVKNDVLCNGNSDGSIELTTRCGPAGTVTFDWDINPDPGNVSVISGLTADNYSVEVTKGTENVPVSVDVDEPDALSVDITNEDYFCTVAEDSVVIEVAGGTPDYTIALSGAGVASVTTSDNYTFYALVAGKYYVDVTDANACAFETDSFTLVVDTEAPTFDSLADYYTSNSALVDIVYAGEPIFYDYESYTHEDNDTIWSCEGDPVNEEFSFVRTWTVVDDCGNANQTSQTIHVGNNPYFESFPNDTTIDFCRSSSVSLTSPTFADACALDSNLLSWIVIDEETGDTIVSGTGAFSGVALPQPVANDTIYVVEWKVTDAVGMFITDVQEVTITKPILIDLSPVGGSEDVCEGASVTFDVSFSGGRESFNTEPTFSPVGTWTPDVAGNHAVGQYNVSTLTTIGTITVGITDDDSGCSVSVVFENYTDFNVHTNISTQDIELVH